jgi:hypothetical protein
MALLVGQLMQHMGDRRMRFGGVAVHSGHSARLSSFDRIAVDWKDGVNQLNRSWCRTNEEILTPSPRYAAGKGVRIAKEPS